MLHFTQGPLLFRITRRPGVLPVSRKAISLPDLDRVFPGVRPGHSPACGAVTARKGALVQIKSYVQIACRHHGTPPFNAPGRSCPSTRRRGRCPSHENLGRPDSTWTLRNRLETRRQNAIRHQLREACRVFSIQRARRSLAAPLAMASRARTTPSAR